MWPRTPLSGSFGPERSGRGLPHRLNAPGLNGLKPDFHGLKRHKFGVWG